MSDVDTTLYFVVRIPVYGDPLREEDRMMLALARSIHHGVKPDAALATVRDLNPDDEDPRHFGRTAEWVTLDPKGDDMGNHGDDHPAPLVLVYDADADLVDHIDPGPLNLTGDTSSVTARVES